jgi:steroid 5-alpha reductase family enzyme
MSALSFKQSLNLYCRNAPQDWRILDIKRGWIIDKKMPGWLYWICGAFGTAMMSQTIFIGLGSYPAYVALYTDNSSDVNVLDYIAAVICVSAATCSFVADRQMRLWRANKVMERIARKHNLYSICLPVIFVSFETSSS